MRVSKLGDEFPHVKIIGVELLNDGDNSYSQKV
jgi:hypothetical protein